MYRQKYTESEIVHVLLAVLVLSLVIGFEYIISGSYSLLSTAILFSVIIIGLNILAKKLTAHMLDSDVEHKIWSFSRIGFKEHAKMKSEFPGGIFLPLLVSLLSLGSLKLMTILTYETKALKHRAAKRFGHYSFTEMTDWHNGLIGAAGILILLVISFISYFLPFNNLELLSRMATFYALFNILPIPKLDGLQIYFGSRVLYLVLATITAIFSIYALLLV